MSGESRVSLRYPASWRVRAHEPDAEGIYRSFVPAAGGDIVVSLSKQRRPSEWAGEGRVRPSYSEDATHRYGRVQIQEADTLHALRVRAARPAWAQHQAAIEGMLSSFALEQPGEYVLHEDPRFAYRVRVPASWSKTRSLASEDRSVVVFTSPPIGADEDGTVAASLTLNVETVGPGGREVQYRRGIERLGEAFRMIRHSPWGEGHADEMRVETQVSASRIKRFYRIGERYAYALAFEAREDVYHRAWGWFDLIAATFEVMEEP